MQGQDQRGFRLAVRARTKALTAATVDRALTDERSLVVTWVNRGTLHLLRAEDYAWLHAVTTPQLVTGNARRLAQEGVSPAAAERGMKAVIRALDREGPLTRAALRERVAAARVPTDGQALIHVLMLASLRGLIVRGPVVGREQAHVLVRNWLGAQPGVDRDAALAELARRYLAGHGPATDRDLARWAGVPLRDARAGLRAIGGELEGRDGLLRLTRHRSPRSLEPPPPRLLGAFDPFLLGWTSRENVLTAAQQRRVISGGLFRPFAMVRGRGAATWRLRDGQVELEPFGGLAGPDRAALERDAADVVRFLGGWAT